MKKPPILAVLAALFHALGAVAQSAPDADTLAARLDMQTRLFPQEKIYLHTDKPYYMAGDTIWMRAHVADAGTNRPAATSKYVYVEFAAADKPPVGLLPEPPLRFRILRRDSIYAGYIPLPLDAKSGDYTLSAYTAFMRNAGSDYFFRTNIHVAAYGSRYEKQSQRRSAENNFDVAFLPEGGYLVEGIFCTLGFKALKPDGTAVQVSGRITDDKGVQVATFEALHAGMGKVTFSPQPGRTYIAQCTNAAGATKQVRLPAARSDIAVLQVFPTAGRFSAAIAAGSGVNTAGYSLLIQCRGQLCYYGAWDADRKILSFDKRDFPDGVLQLLLLDARGKAVSERLLFCYNDRNEPAITITPDKDKYGRRSPVQVEIECTDASGQPLVADISLAVTDNRIVDPDRTADIRTSLLLESELRGYVEEPAFYFDTEQPTREAAVDALMLTQGWRRYDIPRVIEGRYADPGMPIEIGQEIAGQLVKTGFFRKRNFKGYIVSAMAPNTGFFTATEALPDGRFALNGFDMPDSTKFVIQAMGPEGRTDVTFKLDPETFPQIQTLPIPDWTLKMARVNQHIDAFTDALKNIMLEEIVIMGQKKDPQAFYEVLATRSLDSKEIEKNLYTDLEEAVRNKHGVTIKQGYICVFGPPARYVIDGVFWEPDGLMDGLTDKYPKHIPMDMIKRIDIIPPANTTIFGSRAQGSGVIFIVTKTGTELMGSAQPDPRRVYMQVATPLGYQTPAEFYAPRYDTPKRLNTYERDLRTTLYWNPLLKTDANGKARFDFYTADDGADYTVTLQGITPDGTIVSKQGRIGATE